MGLAWRPSGRWLRPRRQRASQAASSLGLCHTTRPSGARSSSHSRGSAAGPSACLRAGVRHSEHTVTRMSSWRQVGITASASAWCSSRAAALAPLALGPRDAGFGGVTTYRAGGHSLGAGDGGLEVVPQPGGGRKVGEQLGVARWAECRGVGEHGWPQRAAQGSPGVTA